MPNRAWLRLATLLGLSLAVPPRSVPAQVPMPAPPAAADSVPLPEHPRPDFQREAWRNLNGTWRFQLDPEDRGVSRGWAASGLPSSQSIRVPFSWAAPLSGVRGDTAVGWYERRVEVPAAWRGQRVFLVIGASDWRTTAWLDGKELGTHEGGYTPFEFELTKVLQPGSSGRLVIRVDDAARDFKLEGKQGYGNVRGIWQTPYLEARGTTPLRSVHFTPDVDGGRVRVTARLLEKAPSDLTLALRFRNAPLPAVSRRIPRGTDSVSFDVPLPDAHLWTLDDPFLYETTATVVGGPQPDRVDGYFGMRKISVVDLPGTDYRYVALNDRPLYLQLALDQAYHETGYYTFPSDDFLRDEILRAKRVGLNGIREHIKVESPRKLYWADRLGLLVMADVPNFWGEPTPPARAASEKALRGMIERDYNHPAVFAWVDFNETWGLRSKVDGKERYLPETKQWVASVYRLTRALDPTRLAEDNSVCCNVGHTETDLNSWHAYLPGWAWEKHLATISDSTFAGSAWNFEGGWKQARQPNLNSEFGNVWGYEGSTGDVDWSWDYHRAVDAFRRHPKVAGWLYTELHDVVNEWNGYYRFDRSEKETGLGELVPGMSIRDLNSPLYLALGPELSREGAPGQRMEVPLYASFLTDRALGDSLVLRTTLYGWNALGERESYGESTRRVPYRPWLTGALPALSVTLPDHRAVAVLATRLESLSGEPLHANFTTFVVDAPVPAEVTLADGRRARVLTVEPVRFSDQKWSLKQWGVMDGKKVDGAGSGYFEYRFAWPQGVHPAEVATAAFVAELSSKQLFGKDRADAGKMEGDYMRGRGTFDPSRNPNAYPMTDGTRFPSAVTLTANGVVAGRAMLADDPADSRGILSWHAQGTTDRHLHEAGSYGELVHLTLPREALERAASTGTLVLRLAVDDALPGGLAVYGARFGRYPVDPTVVLVEK